MRKNNIDTLAPLWAALVIVLLVSLFSPICEGAGAIWPMKLQVQDGQLVIIDKITRGEYTWQTLPDPYNICLRIKVNEESIRLSDYRMFEYYTAVGELSHTNYFSMYDKKWRMRTQDGKVKELPLTGVGHIINVMIALDWASDTIDGKYPGWNDPNLHKLFKYVCEVGSAAFSKEKK